MIAEQKIAEVRGAARISEFISPYVSLRRSGRGLMGLCPFHGEQSPSFSVSDEGGFYHCFGCGAGGNVFKFVMQMENLSFPEAVRKVAAHYGIDVPEEGAGAGQASEREGAFEMLSLASKFYRACLAANGFGETVREYLDGRGVTEGARERFHLGAAPASGDALVQQLRRGRLDLRLAERIGLVGLRGGSAYDRFRERLMFPIRDAQGRTLGFGARRIGDGDGPKYLNSSDSPVYHKGRVLYGLYEWRESTRRRPDEPAAPAAPDAARDGELVLVEGYLDVIAMSEAGIANVVAGCGTALTTDQARLVRRHASDVVALFDGDDAGRRAAARSFPVFLESGLWARGVFLPQSEDPDTFVRRNGAAALRSEIQAATPLVESYVRYVADGASGPGRSARVGAELAGVLRKVDNPFEYDDFVKKAALWTGISEHVLREQARPASRPPAPSRPISVASGPPTAEELIVSVLLSDPGCVDRLEKRDIVSHLHTEPWATIAADIFAARDSTAGYVPGDLLAELDSGVRARIVARLQDDPTFGDAETRERVLADSRRRLADEAFERTKRRMLAELRRLEEIGDETGASALLERWNRMKGEQGRGHR
jgi:DNA primase